MKSKYGIATPLGTRAKITPKPMDLKSHDEQQKFRQTLEKVLRLHEDVLKALAKR